MAYLVFVTGGVVSSLGKGVTSAALGALWKACGYRVAFLKFDPYLNVDAGNMDPEEHGEVYVLDDGTQTDLDLGHYERMTGERLAAQNAFTTGQIYRAVLQRERFGGYGGGTVQVMPHITDAIKACIFDVEKDADIVFIEIGGTVGDIEALPFYEAIRQLRHERPKNNTVVIHLSYLLYLSSSHVFKTKPTQRSVRELRAHGIQVDMIFCRIPSMSTEVNISKIASFADVRADSIYLLPDVSFPYALIPDLYEKKVVEAMMESMGIVPKAYHIPFWHDMVARYSVKGPLMRLAVMGHPSGVSEIYQSLEAALCHSALKAMIDLQVVYHSSESIDCPTLGDCDGLILVKDDNESVASSALEAVQWSLRHRKPFLGIGGGFPTVLQTLEAFIHSDGLGHNPHQAKADSNIMVPVADIMEKSIDKPSDLLGFSDPRRLGMHAIDVVSGTTLAKCYGVSQIKERHRHTHALNPGRRNRFESMGVVFSASSQSGLITEAMEWRDHPFFVVVQYRPEFLSTPQDSHPLFDGLLREMIAGHNSKNV
jgi:CTP synthase